jgi:hypothetical protein
MTKLSSFGALAALAMNGCFISTNDNGPVSSSAGALTMRWTVDQDTNPNLCVLAAADQASLRLYTSDGLFAGEYVASCADFETTVSGLEPGGYSAAIDLRDGAGTPRTTQINVDPFNVRPNTTLVIDVDFPADSFR